MKIEGKKKLLTLAAFAAPLILSIALGNIAVLSSQKLKDLKEQQKELTVLKDDFLSLKGLVDSIENKKSLTQVKGVLQAVEEVFLPVGLKQKIKSVKTTGVKELKEAVEEEAEVIIEKADMNEVVNIFYRIENAPFALSVKKAAVKTAFDNPAHLNLAITLSLIKPK